MDLFVSDVEKIFLLQKKLLETIVQTVFCLYM